ncbi:MAG: hypothetical protein HQK86_05410 [Nitrospinae bacterium]|nr:hypothetical protein [Nitrospinota bacterium]
MEIVDLCKGLLEHGEGLRISSAKQSEPDAINKIERNEFPLYFKQVPLTMPEKSTIMYLEIWVL